MSDRTERWARERANHPALPRLTFSERSVLITLAGLHSEVGATKWPTMPQLASLLGLTERRVQGIVYALRDKGALIYTPGLGRGNACSYAFPMSEKDEISEEVASIKDEMSEEKTKSSERKDEIFEGEKTKSSTPDGGTIGGSYGEDTGSTPSLPFLSVTPETRGAASDEVKTAGRRKRDPKWTAEPSVSEEFTEKMVAKHRGDLGEERTRFEIRRALTHSAARKYNPCDLYVENWLRGEVEKVTARGTAPPRNGTGPPAAAQEVVFVQRTGTRRQQELSP